jgi:hypothetical protein
MPAAEGDLQYKHQRDESERTQKKKSAISLVRTDAKEQTLDKFLGGNAGEVADSRPPQLDQEQKVIPVKLLAVKKLIN